MSSPVGLEGRSSLRVHTARVRNAEGAQPCKLQEGSTHSGLQSRSVKSMLNLSFMQAATPHMCAPLLVH